MEWCYRIAKKGYHYYFYSQAEIFHFNCGSSGFSEWKTGQILISEWLYFMKIKGKFYFFSMIMLLMLNHLMDSALFIKQKLLGSINENDIMSMKRRRFERSAIRRYFFRILFHYNKKESSCKNFLKYEVK
jgi:GT2 family glycosyltransferase